jgi:hypothetical protein
MLEDKITSIALMELKRETRLERKTRTTSHKAV